MTDDPKGRVEASRSMPLLFLLTGIMSLGYGSVFTLLADIRDRFGFDDAAVGLIAFAGFATGFASQVVLARYADRGHTALMLRSGVLAAAAGVMWMLVAAELWQWVGARLLLGLGAGTVGPAVRRLVIARDPANVGANLGRQTAFDVGGFVLGPLVAAVAAELFGLRAPFAVLLALYVAAFALLTRLDLRAGTVAESSHRAVRRMLVRPAVQSALCTAVAFYLTIGMFEALWSLLLRDLGSATWLIGVTLSLFTVPMVLFAARGGRLAQAKGPLRVMSVSIVVAAACTAVYGFGPLWVLIVASGVHALADAYTLPGNQVAVAIASPADQLATGQGLLGATGLAVAAMAALGGAAVYETYGREVVFTGTAVLMLVFLAAARWRFAVHLRSPAPLDEAPEPA
ncbi:MAG: MFS transporter [Acidimicrobiales bacterium]|jgi:DHA1 family multidrug resistance protein-like MFS transporter|nr:MFS transporter [Acidimicrobiales bacterium]